MELRLTRKIFNTNDTIGILFIDGVKFCYTLEDVIREVKVYGETAIPKGTYKVELRESPHFQRILPHLIDVPGFENILMHPGNTEQDTEGCILIAFHTDNNKIWSEAATELVEKLTGQNNITITVE